MKKYALYLVLIFSVAVNIAVAGTLAYHYWRVSRDGAGLVCGQKPLGRFMRENLQLEDKETSRLQSLFKQDRENLVQLRCQIHQQRQILFDLLDKPQINQVQVDQQIEKIAALQAAMQKVVTHQIINLKASLPEEKQRRLLKAIRQRSGCGPFGQGPIGPGFGKKQKGRW
ncbi:MAG: periplasmic heavy metal sensor [bacterium]